MIDAYVYAVLVTGCTPVAPAAALSLCACVLLSFVQNETLVALAVAATWLVLVPRISGVALPCLATAWEATEDLFLLQRLHLRSDGSFFMSSFGPCMWM